MEHKNTEWTNVISSEHSLFKLNLKRFGIMRFGLYVCKRDFVSSFKQTILISLFFYQPHFTTSSLSYCIWQHCQFIYRWRPKIFFYLAG